MSVRDCQRIDEYGSPSQYVDYVQVIGDTLVLFDGEIAVYQDGFDWTALVNNRRTARPESEATAVDDGTIIARGTVTSVEETPKGEQLIHVTGQL